MALFRYPGVTGTRELTQNLKPAESCVAERGMSRGWGSGGVGSDVQGSPVVRGNLWNTHVQQHPSVP